jgi:photosystem II stability/assembly factor-like uncharacterized protein
MCPLGLTSLPVFPEKRQKEAISASPNDRRGGLSHRSFRLRGAVLVLAILLLAGAARAGEPAFAPAEASPFAAQQMILGATVLPGGRVVAVGARGTVLLSDDGVAFRQAAHVPVQLTLTSVAFVDDRQGWAGGHGGVVLHTVDGGETWDLLRSETAEDRPIFALLFQNSRDGIAVGLWSLLLVTHDGGVTWQQQALPQESGAGHEDRNLTSVFADASGTLFVTAEGGRLFRSRDGGATWSSVDIGYCGTLWTGRALADGTLLVGGLRGSLFRSADGGRTWAAVPSGTRSSITGFAQGPDGRVVATALDGVQLDSRDDGASFQTSERPDRMALTALVVRAGRLLLFSKQGIATE